MAERRRRIVFYFETAATLAAIKDLIGRQVDLIAAGDASTVEAALRIYKQVDVVLAEKSSGNTSSLDIMATATLARPDLKRVMLVDPAHMEGVYEALRNRTIDGLLMSPWRPAQLCDTLGLQMETKPIASIAPRGLTDRGSNHAHRFASPS
jgi:response regulator RpfG family c-di-GMP phosphodiesterase